MADETPAGAQPTLICNYNNKQRLLDLGVGQHHWTMHLGGFLKSIEVNATNCRQVLEEVGGVDPPRVWGEFQEWAVASLPADLTGQTMVDIGGYDGFLARGALDRGAKRATVIDSQQYLAYTMEGYPFGWAKPAAYPGVEYVIADLRDLAAWPLDLWPADLVCYFNVIYHVTDVWGAIEQLRHVTKRELLICTSYAPGEEAFWKVAPDPSRTIYMAPSISGLRKTMEHYGFQTEEVARNDELVIVRGTI